MNRWGRLILPCLTLLACALLAVAASAEIEAGDTWTWGLNEGGQLGDGTLELRNVPVKVPGTEMTTSTAGGLLHSLALLSDGTIRSWGNNDLGQLGNGTNDSSPAPVAVVGIDHVIAIAAGFDHSIALKSDGTVWSWGGNRYGQLGNDTTEDSPLPVQVAGLERITEIAAAGYHNVARRSDGTVWFWGTPGMGGAGFEGAQFGSVLVPEQLPSPLGVTDVAAGVDHDLLLKDGFVFAWGRNEYGQLGDGTPNDKLSGFVQAQGLKDIVAVAAGSYHGLALNNKGTLYSWGWNGSGQLGNGTTTNSTIPVEIKGLKSVTAVAAGWYHNLATTSDGSLWVWGDNLFGKLGDGTFRLSTVPKKVEDFYPVIGVAAGADHSLAVRGQPPTPTPTPIAKTGTSRSPQVRSAANQRTPARTQ